MVAFRERYAGRMLINAVPQRQGSVSPRAGELAAGCLALAELAGSALGMPVNQVPQSGETSSTVDGVANREVLLANRVPQLAALEAPEGPVLTIGGDCGVELIPIGVAQFRYSGLAVAWFDAHPDLNTAESSPSGAFHGMVLRSLFGQGDADFAGSPALERAVLVGTRSFDPAEREAVESGLVTRASVETVAEALAGAGNVYLHVDLDVLDPDEFGGIAYPEPGGLTIEQLVAGIRALSAFDVIGAAITECLDTGPELRALVPVIEAIGERLGS
jgi:arginase